MSNLILNEGYEKNTDLFYGAQDDKIFKKKRKYIDLSMCAGSVLLGHNHKIFRQSVLKFLSRKVSNVAAPNIYAKIFATNIKRIVPNSEKIIFCNSGTEAVLKSLRLARALNGKSKIALVTGGWHGSVDQLLFKAGENLKPIKLSSGLSSETSKKLILIPYNDIKKSKSILDKNKDKISCLIIEPIQGSLPYENIKKYLKFLEVYCKKNKIILIFDEMITGLRTNCSSVQNYFKIKPDISTFGKCFGGGFPIGIISVSKVTSKKLKKIKPKVFFGGTFSGNSIVSFVGNEILNYIIKNKKKIFKKINTNAEYFEKNLNNFFKLENIDLKIYRFQSMLRLVYTKTSIKDRLSRDFLELKKNKLILRFRNYIKSKYIYIPASGIIFLSYSHEKKHMNFIIEEFKKGSLKIFKKSK
jgi:glutamate-1-semialdehyde 2,1-aminomutase